jgi:hypothetical protein
LSEGDPGCTRGNAKITSSAGFHSPSQATQLRILKLHPIAERVVGIREVNLQDITTGIHESHKPTLARWARIPGMSMANLIFVVLLSGCQLRKAAATVFEFRQTPSALNLLLKLNEGNADVGRKVAVAEQPTLQLAETRCLCHM